MARLGLPALCRPLPRQWIGQFLKTGNQSIGRIFHKYHHYGSQRLYDDLCSSFRYSQMDDGTDGVLHRWADLVLDRGCFHAVVGAGWDDHMVCRDPLFRSLSKDLTCYVPPKAFEM